MHRGVPVPMFLTIVAPEEEEEEEEEEADRPLPTSMPSEPSRKLCSDVGP
jgi:hypothetical protein